MDPLDEIDAAVAWLSRECGPRTDLPVDDGCPLRFPEDRRRELRLLDAVRYGDAESVDEIRHL